MSCWNNGSEWWENLTLSSNKMVPRSFLIVPNEMSVKKSQLTGEIYNLRIDLQAYAYAFSASIAAFVSAAP